MVFILGPIIRVMWNYPGKMAIREPRKLQAAEGSSVIALLVAWALC